MNQIRVTIWNEFIHERDNPHVAPFPDHLSLRERYALLGFTWDERDLRITGLERG